MSLENSANLHFQSSIAIVSYKWEAALLSEEGTCSPGNLSPHLARPLALRLGTGCHNNCSIAFLTVELRESKLFFFLYLNQN